MHKAKVKKRANPLAAAGLAIIMIAVLFGVPIWWELNNGPVNPLPTAGDTPIPLPTDTPSLEAALNGVSPQKEIVQAEVFAPAETMQIVFVMGQDLAGAEDFMLNAICTVRVYLPEGYRIRFAGDRGDTIEIMSATVDYAATQALACPPSVEFGSIAIEYSYSEGLR
jgi:hypothetical protein